MQYGNVRSNRTADEIYLQGVTMDQISDTNFKFNLGREVKDTITGFKGIVIARHQWLNNCNTYGVQCQELKDGMPQEMARFDEPQLIVVVKNVITPQQKTGGPDRKVSQPNR